MAEAESSGTNPIFQKSARMRAFARAMGDDMSSSTVGFASPTVAGVGGVDVNIDELSGPF